MVVRILMMGEMFMQSERVGELTGIRVRAITRLAAEHGPVVTAPKSHEHGGNRAGPRQFMCWSDSRTKIAHGSLLALVEGIRPAARGRFLDAAGCQFTAP